jgi:hypothetical protein
VDAGPDRGRAFLQVMRRAERTAAKQACAAAGLDRVHTVPGKHFPQEDQAPAIAQRIADLAATRPH